MAIQLSAIEQNPAQDDHQSLRIAFKQLWEAWLYSVGSKVDRWQFAMEFNELRQFGVFPSDLRWLVSLQYVKAADEVTLPEHTTRQFHALKNVQFSDKTCFVLSEKGIANVKKPSDLHQVPVGAQVLIPPQENSSRVNHLPMKELPSWDASLKLLNLGGLTVKQYRVPAPNQERIIAAFQEVNWRTRIDDPLPRISGRDPQRRLNDTIRCLNRHQANELLRFRGDGTGTGVFWEKRSL